MPGIFSDSGDGFPISANLVAETDAFGLTGSGSIGDGLSPNVTTRLRKKGSAPQGAFGDRFPRLLSDVDAIRGQVRPGFSSIRKARIDEVNTARDRAIGSLRSNAARRKILGSQFAVDAEARAELEGGKLRGEAEAQSFLEEVDTNLKLLDFEFGQINTALQRELQELQLSASFSTAVANLLNSNAQTAKSIQLAESQGTGQFFGTLLGTAFGPSLEAAGSAATKKIFPSLAFG